MAEVLVDASSIDNHVDVILGHLQKPPKKNGRAVPIGR